MSYIPFDFSYVLFKKENEIIKSFPNLRIRLFRRSGALAPISEVSNVSSSGYIYDAISNSWNGSSTDWKVSYNDDISSWILSEKNLQINSDGTTGKSDNGYFYLMNSSGLSLPYDNETSASYLYYPSKQTSITSAYWTTYQCPGGVALAADYITSTSGLIVEPLLESLLEPEEIPSFSGAMFVSYSLDSDFFSERNFVYDNGKWKYEETVEDFLDPFSSQTAATYTIEQDELSSWILKKDDDILFRLSGNAKKYYLPFNYKDTEKYTYPAYDESSIQSAYWVYVGDDEKTFIDICVKPTQSVNATEVTVKISYSDSTLSSDFNGTYAKRGDMYLKDNKYEYIIYKYDTCYALMKYEDYESIKNNPSYITNLLAGNDPGTYEIFILSSDNGICDEDSSRNICKSYSFNSQDEYHWKAFGTDPNGTVTNVYVNYRLTDISKEIKVNSSIDVQNVVDYPIIDLSD